MAAPNGYPLPWCHELDAAYWQINLHLCLTRPGWREKQSRKDMRSIIEWIDQLVADVELRPVDLQEIA